MLPWCTKTWSRVGQRPPWSIVSIRPNKIAYIRRREEGSLDRNPDKTSRLGRRRRSRRRRSVCLLITQLHCYINSYFDPAINLHAGYSSTNFRNPTLIILAAQFAMYQFACYGADRLRNPYIPSFTQYNFIPNHPLELDIPRLLVISTLTFLHQTTDMWHSVYAPCRLPDPINNLCIHLYTGVLINQWNDCQTILPYSGEALKALTMVIKLWLHCLGLLERVCRLVDSAY